MYGCLTGATYSHKVDILAPTATQTMTGQLEKVWSYAKTVSCYAESIQTDAVSDDSSGKKFQDEYSEYEYINVHIMTPLSKRTRIVNLRTQDGTPLWPQYERPQLSVVFEVQGCLPILNPFGQIMEYKVLAKRTQIQDYTVSVSSSDSASIQVSENAVQT